MSEFIFGADALQRLPIGDIVRPMDEAFSVLTQHVRSATRKNLDFILSHLDPKIQQIEQYKAELATMRDQLDSIIPPGGYGMSSEEIVDIYAQGPKSKLSDLFFYYFEEYFPALMEQKGIERNPEVWCVGYIIDALDLVSPAFATKDDAMGVLAQCIEESNPPFTPYVFGRMIDSALRLRSNSNLGMEVMMSREAVEEVRDLYIESALEDERLSFEAAISYTEKDVVVTISPFSAS